MNTTMSLLFLPIVVALMIGGMGLVKMAAARFGWSAEIQRKLVHISTGLFAMCLPWLLPQSWLVYLLLGLAVGVMLVLRIPAIATRGIGTALHGVERKSWGDLMLVAAVATLYFKSNSGTEPVLYLLPLAVLTLSDAAAALAGSAYGRMHFAVEDGQKSIEGSAIFFLITWILAMVALLLLSDIDREKVVILSLMTAAFATVIEADSWRGFDNYFVPVGVLFIVTNHANSSQLELVLLALSFVAILILMNTFGTKYLGLSKHTARAYTASIFMITAVTEVQNLILPLTVLLVQTWTRSVRPSNTNHPDLDVLAMLATVSFISLIGGQVMGLSAISFYQIVCANLAIQFLILALADRSKAIKISALLAAISVAMGILIFVWSLNGAVSSWHRDLIYFAPIVMLLTAALPLLRPAFFDQDRYLKTGLLAAIPMTIAYLIEFQIAGAAL